MSNWVFQSWINEGYALINGLITSAVQAAKALLAKVPAKEMLDFGLWSATIVGDDPLCNCYWEPKELKTKKMIRVLFILQKRKREGSFEQLESRENGTPNRWLRNWVSFWFGLLKVSACLRLLSFFYSVLFRPTFLDIWYFLLSVVGSFCLGLNSILLPIVRRHVCIIENIYFG